MRGQLFWRRFGSRPEMGKQRPDWSISEERCDWLRVMLVMSVKGVIHSLQGRCQGVSLLVRFKALGVP